jgi:hypothetical protein
MNIFNILLITIGWVVSIYLLAAWRSQSKKHKDGIVVSALYDGVTQLYFMASGLALLVFILYLL